MSDDLSRHQEGQAIKQKLLLVEDDDSSRIVLSMIFEDERFQVVQARDGIEALEKVQLHQPAIIVSDLMMPKMSGLELLKHLKGDQQTASIPVLILTAAAHEDNELEMLQQGAHDFVSKTVDYKVLVARVQGILQRATQSTAL